MGDKNGLLTLPVTGRDTAAPLINGIIKLFQREASAKGADHKISAVFVKALSAHSQAPQQLLHHIPELLSAADAALKQSDTRLWQCLQPLLSFALLDNGAQGMTAIPPSIRQSGTVNCPQDCRMMTWASKYKSDIVFEDATDKSLARRGI